VLGLTNQKTLVREFYEEFVYEPGLQATNDLEMGVKHVTAVAEAVGVGNADYSAALTLPDPNDVEVEVLRIAARLALTIDAMNAATVLNCRVYVDAQDANHRLFDLNWAAAGAKLAVVDTHAAALAIIFAALSDGAAHTFYVFLWGDNANGADVSLVQLWEAVGCGNPGAWAGSPVLRLAHSGMATVAGTFSRQGTGTFQAALTTTGTTPTTAQSVLEFGATASTFELDQMDVARQLLVMVAAYAVLGFYTATVATDLVYVRRIGFVVRRML